MWYIYKKYVPNQEFLIKIACRIKKNRERDVSKKNIIEICINY